MGVYIRDMTIEEFAEYGGEYAGYLIGTGQAEGISDHGDLIDRDEAAHEIWLIRCEECGAAEWACECCDNGTAMKRVMDAPVVIPAERSEE